MDISEKNFEATIEQALLADLPAPNDPGKGASGGYRNRKPEDYHRTLCLDPDVILDFLYATQPKEWDKLKAQHGRGPGRRRVEPLPLQQVRAVDRGRGDVDDHLARAGGGVR